MSNNGILQSKNIKYLPASTTTYNITMDDDIIMVNSSLNAVTLVLPNIRSGAILENPKCFKINDYSGNAGTNNITIQGCGGDTVNSSSFTISTNSDSAEVNVVNPDEWFASSASGSSPVTGFVPYTGATANVDLGIYGITTYYAVVGVQQGGYVTSGAHKMQVVANSSSQTPLVVIGGSGVIEYWKDTTPTKAVSFGMAIPGNAATDDFILSAYNGAIWSQLFSVTSSGGNATLGATSTYSGGAYLVTGSAGAGYVKFPQQSSVVPTPADGFNLYAGSTNTVNWVSPNGFITRLDSTANLASRTYTFPDASGTLVLSSTLSGYVPYTGATTNVDLGSFAILATSPVFATRTITPIILGGTGTTQTLTYQTTSGVGASGADHIFKVGNNGATEAARITNEAQVLVGTPTSIGGSLANFRVLLGTATVDIGQISSGVAGIWFNTATPSTTNYVLRGASGDVGINCSVSGGSLTHMFAGVLRYTYKTNMITMTPVLTAGGAITNFTFNVSADTTSDAGVNIPKFRVTGASVQWNAGALALQYFSYFSTNTITFLTSSTATLAANVVTDVVNGGSGATITSAVGFYNVATALTNVANGYGAFFNSPTGATNNFALGLSAGTTTTAPLRFLSGTNLTAAIAGVMEYNNTFHLTNSDAVRRHLVLAPNTTKVTAGAPYTNDGYVVVNIGGTDFKMMTTA